MQKITGSYAEAIVYATTLEETARIQIETLLNQPFVKGSKVRIMPDVHAGAGCVIGFTADLGDMVIPNLVGVDIGCGMAVASLGKADIDLKGFDLVVHQVVPSGKNVHSSPIAEFDLSELYCYEFLKNQNRFQNAIGTLGGGNHFIELNVDHVGDVYLVIHSGSRNLGKQVAEYYQNLAIEMHAHDTPKDLCYLVGDYRNQYLHDMEICQKYASENRLRMMVGVMNAYGLGEAVDAFETIHNYISFEDNIIRKGAVSAKNGERLIIPMNMRDGSLLCIGKGNDDWNNSAPHGAGRLMGRNAAKRALSMSKFSQDMKGIYSSTVCEDTLDESPDAYKPMDEIIANLEGTAEIYSVIKPIYNFKAVE